MENQTNTTKVIASDIVCGGCAGAIKNALSRVNGVLQVEVDVETKIVSVQHNGEVNLEKIAEVLDDAGFPAD